ncbi:hypothetical protein GCM10023259_081880 [Thermocatellispora tengchongensis]
MVLTLGLCGGGVLVAAPLIGSSASAATDGVRSAAMAVPSQLEPDDNVGQEEPSDPVTTVTTTITPPAEPGPTEVTTTVTVTPSKTKTSKPPEQPAPPSTTAAPPPAQPTQQPVQPPPTTAPPPTETEEPTVSLPTVSDVVTTPPTALASPTQVPPSSDSVPVELREAAPEFDQQTISRQLGIPALVLVLLALFAVLIFEGRLRRMAHAAAVRKAGPKAPGRHRSVTPTADPAAAAAYTGYPAGPGYSSGYAQVAYPGGTAYAPIISFVPVTTYPSGYQQYGTPEQGYYAQQGYGMPAPGQEYPAPQPSDPATPSPAEYTAPDAFTPPSSADYAAPGTFTSPSPADPPFPVPEAAAREPGTPTPPLPGNLPPESFLEGPHDLTPFDAFTPHTPPSGTGSGSSWSQTVPLADDERNGPGPVPSGPQGTALFPAAEPPQAEEAPDGPEDRRRGK